MITWYEISDKGNRSHNEDSVGSACINERYCFVLADGLGGHGKGEVASRLVVDSILKDFRDNYRRNDFLVESFQNAQTNLLIRQKQLKCENEMKTTVVCLLIDGDYVQWAYAGDSRLYYFNHRKIKQRTIDHSVPQMLVLSKQLKEKDIRFHEDRNRLLRVMGMEYDKPVFEVANPIKLKKGQAFLLCSDGFWELVLEKEMEKALKSTTDVSDWILEMKKILLVRGEDKDMDNYSSIGIMSN